MPDTKNKEKKGVLKRKPDLSPMMQQYIEIKNANPDCILFYHMGDFFEMFFEDAITASQLLNIQLTKRGNVAGDEIPMCGVPVHSSRAYLQKLVAAGHRVAICEQVDDDAAKKSGPRKLMNRQVTQIITAATITDDDLQSAKSSYYLLSLSPQTKARRQQSTVSLCYCDISSGDFFVNTVPLDQLENEVYRISPKEILLPDSLYEHSEFISLWRSSNIAIVPHAQELYDAHAGRRRMEKFYDVKSLAGFCEINDAELAAANVNIAYIERTQRNAKPILSPPRRHISSDFLEIDAAARRSLELVTSASEHAQHSLIDILDKCATGAGSRLLRFRLSSPSAVIKTIHERHQIVEAFLNDTQLRETSFKQLRSLADTERSLSRLQLGRAVPQDLHNIKSCLIVAGEMRELISHTEINDSQTYDQILADLCLVDQELSTTLTRALLEPPLPKLNSGNFVAEGFDERLDQQQNIETHSQTTISKLQKNYRDISAIKGLRIKQNNIIGFFVETNIQQASALENCESIKFHKRQSLANIVRFTTDELIELADTIDKSNERAQEIKVEIFEQLSLEILKSAKNIRRLVDVLAELDFYQALAAVAHVYNWNRPVLTDGLDFDIKGGRHPVVELSRISEDKTFNKNDCDLGYRTSSDPNARISQAKIYLLTGPNMAGKSTYLRQNAIIAILAQMGSFVPAYSALIGVIDKVYSRVGASDELARGNSTFMVEMTETASILNYATDRSLVIFDEIGRGTATFDGVSIAQSVVEYIHNEIKCRTIFATHYHELTRLTNSLPRLVLASTQVKEWKGEIIFQYTVAPGTAAGSFGVQIARLAGLPKAVIKRASFILNDFTSQASKSITQQMEMEVPLFSYIAQSDNVSSHESDEQPPQFERRETLTLERLQELNPDELSARDALDEIYRLKELLRESDHFVQAPPTSTSKDSESWPS